MIKITNDIFFSNSRICHLKLNNNNNNNMFIRFPFDGHASLLFANTKIIQLSAITSACQNNQM
ncbi:hypothetical protein Hanom_Chr13g01204951 [Helianthus anomalus]